MNGIRHPYTKALYEPEDGRVKVTEKSGRIGWFAQNGQWLEGDRFDADPQLCVWIGAPRGVHRLQQVDEPSAT